MPRSRKRRFPRKKTQVPRHGWLPPPDAEGRIPDPRAPRGGMDTHGMFGVMPMLGREWPLFWVVSHSARSERLLQELLWACSDAIPGDPALRDGATFRLTVNQRTKGGVLWTVNLYAENVATGRGHESNWELKERADHPLSVFRWEQAVRRHGSLGLMVARHRTGQPDARLLVVVPAENVSVNWAFPGV